MAGYWSQFPHILVGKYEEERPLGRPSRRWKYYIRIGLKELGEERAC